MGKEYLSYKGINHYIIDLDKGEGFSFSDYGQGLKPVSANYVLSICNKVNEVEVLSFLGNNVVPKTDIYFKGKHLTVNEKLLTSYNMLPKNLEKKSHIVYRISREEEVGLTQILIPLSVGVMNHNILSNIYKNIKC